MHFLSQSLMPQSSICCYRARWQCKVLPLSGFLLICIQCNAFHGRPPLHPMMLQTVSCPKKSLMWNIMLYSCCWIPGGTAVGRCWWCIEGERERDTPTQHAGLHKPGCSRWHETDLLSVLGSEVGFNMLDVLKHVKGNMKCFFYFNLYVPVKNVHIAKCSLYLIFTLIFFTKTKLKGFLWSLFLYCLHCNADMVNPLW